MKKIAFALTLIATLTGATACGAQWRDSNTNQGRPTSGVDGGSGAAPQVRIQVRRDTDANRIGTTPRIGEIMLATDTMIPYIGDGATTGGIPMCGAVDTTGVVRVVDYSATCDGVADDTAEIQAALDACEAAGGCVLEFPSGGTCLVSPPAADTPIFTIGASNITFDFQGATIKVSATASTDPTNITSERRNGFVFHATGKSNLAFIGGEFDGNRGAAVPSYYGFIGVFDCENVTIRDNYIHDGDNDSGMIFVSGYDYGTSTHGIATNITIENNIFEKCSRGPTFEQGLRNVFVSNNKLLWLDISPTSYTTGRFSETRTLRGIRLNGFTIAPEPTISTPAPRFDNVVVIGNQIIGSHFGIEIWNNDDDEGDDPTYTSGVVVANNTIQKTFWGISIVTFSDQSVTGNTFNGMSNDDVTYYEGRTNGQTNANLWHTGIEARAGKSVTVSGNSVRSSGYWDASSGWLNTGDGISVGVGTDAAGTLSLPTDINVTGNTVQGFGAGIRLVQSREAVVASNRITNCFRAVIADYTITQSNKKPNPSASPWRNNLLSGNVILAEPSSIAVSSSASPAGPTGLIELQGNWDIIGNVIEGAATTATRLLAMRGYDSTGADTTADIGTYVVRGNTFRNFSVAPILDGNTANYATISVTLDGNLFNSMQASPGSTLAAYRIERNLAVNKTIRMGRNRALNLPRAVLMGATVGALTETYDFGEWDTDGTMSQPWRSESGGGTISGGTPIVRFGPRMLAKHLRLDTGTGTGDPTVDIASMLPARSVILGVRAELASTITASAGTTGWAIGTTTDADAWGTGIALTSATKVGPSNWTVAYGSVFPGTSAGSIRITALGGADPYFTDGYVNIFVDYILMDGDGFN